MQCAVWSVMCEGVSAVCSGVMCEGVKSAVWSGGV